jgi:hypothetical protein
MSKHCETCTCGRRKRETRPGLTLMLETIRQLEADRIAPTVQTITDRSGTPNRGSVRAWLSQLVQSRLVSTRYPSVGPERVQEYHSTR